MINLLKIKQNDHHFAEYILKLHLITIRVKWVSVESYKQYISIGWGNGLAPIRQQAIAWTNDDKVLRHLIVLWCHSDRELIHTLISKWAIVLKLSEPFWVKKFRAIFIFWLFRMLYTHIFLCLLWKVLNAISNLYRLTPRRPIYRHLGCFLSLLFLRSPARAFLYSRGGRQRSTCVGLRHDHAVC